MSLCFRVFPLDDSPGFVIYRTAAKLKAELTRAFQADGYDVTPEQWAVLSRLWESEGDHQTALAERSAKDRHNMTRILNLLERNSLIRRQPDPGDKRYQRIFLTDAGKALKEKLIPIVRNHLQKALNGLTQQDLCELKRIHEKIEGNLSLIGSRDKQAD
ncbi:MAG TPA: MarR family transcriptional regulator [Desulfomonilaceae bacterium]|nr:MarR family transcriptional regulator [Desulfomonilaceae bacterium]